MATSDIRYDAPRAASPNLSDLPPDLAGLSFPGCTARRITREEIGCYEGRLEFWDGQIATAWVAEPTTPAHEAPSAALAQLVERIAAVRGAPIACYGTMALMVRDDDGQPRRIMQADQSLYVHSGEIDLRGAPAVVVGEHPLPDVVLEVDHTTDVRRGKLSLYESWGFPELWVEVPDQRTPSRRVSHRSGLTIHVLQDGRFRESPDSHAFPGWTGAEIHAALNERRRSPRTHAVLERVGSVLGAREGTGPDDDPLLGSQRRAARSEALAGTARALLRQRGIAVSPELAANPALFAGCSEEAVVAAALACTAERDFVERLRGP